MEGILWHNQTLFKNPEIFDFAYLPESFNYRNSQLQALASSIKPLLSNLKPSNCLIKGETATGKTTAIKIIFKEAEQQTDSIIFCHINAGLYSLQSSFFSELHKKIIGFSPPSSGIPLKQIYDSIFKKLQKEKKSLILAIDDSLYLENLNKMVYEILRANEAFSVKTSVWLVVNEKESINLDNKSSSVFSPQYILFPKYTQEELFSILKTRADYGLYKNIISLELLKKIAEHTSQKDLRFGIELLKNTVIEAENQSKKIVDVSHLDKALKNLSITKEAEKKQDDEIESHILSILNKSEFSSGELFAELNKEIKTNYTKFYRSINKLSKKGNIVLKEISDKGKTRLVSLKK